MYFISSWICSRSSKNLFVKIVHPGGRVEIHDRPIIAAELLTRHPKCCVAHPDVFHQPYAVVSPSTTLALGHNYYVVPIRTIRRLQLKYSGSPRQLPDLQSHHHLEQKSVGGMEHSSSCWLMKSRKNGEKVCLENASKRGMDCRRERGDHKNFAGVKNGGTRLSLAHLDQWQPGLESIMEE